MTYRLHRDQASRQKYVLKNNFHMNIKLLMERYSAATRGKN